MSIELPVALTLHLLASIVWVGGMFFAHLVLRPTANAHLQPPQRLPLLLGVFDRFFPWVWVAVVTLLATGFWIFFRIFHARAGLYVHLMMGLGLLMAGIFVFLWSLPYRRMGRALAAGDLLEAGRQLAQVRRLMATNLVLGLLVAVLAGARWPVALLTLPT